MMFFLCLTLASAAVYALDLPSVARRERARRGAVSGKPTRTFDDGDLERYRAEKPSDPGPRPPPALGAGEGSRDLVSEQAHWRKEAERHQREMAKIEASLRRLQWRLAEKRSRKRSRDWLTEDPSIEALEDSIKALHEEKRQLDERFRERARKEGALPGWLR
jgi:hypothetical protein